MKKGKKRITAALIIALVILTGCGSTLDNSESKSESAYDTGGGYYASSDSAAAVTENYEYAEDDAAAAEEGYEPESGSEVMDENAASAERKLIKTVSMEVETENYEVLLGSLENRIAELAVISSISTSITEANIPVTRNCGMRSSISVFRPGIWTNLLQASEKKAALRTKWNRSRMLRCSMWT